MDLVPFCFSDAVSKVFATLRGATAQKRIRLVKFVESGVPNQVLGDRYRIEHVIANLLSNAIKFSSEESIIETYVSLDTSAAEEGILS